MKKKLLSLLCVALLVVGAVVGTYAYLFDSDEAVNTFTVGNVEIDLDEALVDEYGNPLKVTKGEGETEIVEKVDTVEDADRIHDGNTYKLIPGHTYVKDPTVTVKAGSERSYVRMFVTFNYSSQLDTVVPNADLTSIFNGYNAKWQLADVVEDSKANTRTYEFRYADTVTTLEPKEDDVLEPLFTGFTLPSNITKEQLATLVTTDDEGNITDQFKITVVAQAIQADTFADANDAWAHF